MVEKKKKFSQIVTKHNGRSGDKEVIKDEVIGEEREERTAFGNQWLLNTSGDAQEVWIEG